MLYSKNDPAIRTMALQEAVRICGSETKLGLAIKIKQPTISKLISNPSMKISYDVALMIEKYTGVDVERLMPHKKEVNYYLKTRGIGECMLREICTNTIITTDSVSLPFSGPNRFVIVGTDLVLISGLAILNAHSGNKIKALILDLTSLIAETSSMATLIYKLLISERIAIGLRLEQLIGNRQGQRVAKNNQEPSSICYQVIGRTDTHAAKIIGFNKDTYIRAKKVYLSKNRELINAVDHKTRSIAKAAKLIKPKFNHNN